MGVKSDTGTVTDGKSDLSLSRRLFLDFEFHDYSVTWLPSVLFSGVVSEFSCCVGGFLLLLPYF